MQKINIVASLVVTLITSGALTGMVYAQDDIDTPLETIEELDANDALELIEDSSYGGWFKRDKFGVGAFAGTAGIGGHVSYEVNEWLYLKGQIGGFSYSTDQTIDNVDYEGDLSLFSAGVSANINPLYKVPVMNGFRISVGAYGVDNNVELNASSPGQSIELGGASFTLGANDRLEGNVGFSSFAPYAGLGWDWDFGKDDQFIISFDAGVLFTGTADVDLRAVGAFADFTAQNPSLNLQSEIDAEIDSIREEVEDYPFYPVVSLGFTWRF